MQQTTKRFPFGAPVVECGVQTPGDIDTYILGAYPSALHVHWDAPNGASIAAIAVDNEPEVFWDGADAAKYVDEWASKRFDPAWGTVSPRGNGSSGVWVREHILAP